jgi:NitT/TauT family transport system substrate-binding protein
VGNFPNTALTLPFAIAQAQGYFTDAGLNVQVVPATSGPALASELIGGTTQIAVEVPPNAFPAMQQGEQLEALPPYGKLDLAVVAPDGSGITSLKSLAGKKVGVTAVGAFTKSSPSTSCRAPASTRAASPSSPSAGSPPSWRR